MSPATVADHACAARAYEVCRGCRVRVEWCHEVPPYDLAAIRAARQDPEIGFRCRDCRRRPSDG